MPPLDEQEPNESRKLWSGLTDAIYAKDMEAATESKSKVEEAQREDRRKREEHGEKHLPRFFEQRGGRWVPKVEVPLEPEAAIKVINEFIWAPAPTKS